MSINYLALKTEINTDPTGLGYAPLINAGNYSGVVALLNAPGGSSVNRVSVPAEDIIGALDATEAKAMLAAEVAWLQLILSPQVVVLSSGTKNLLGALFPQATRPTSRAAIIALFNKASASRAEVLFGEGTVITNEDFTKALKS